MTSRELVEIQSALRKTTETLARELVEPTPSAPDWSAFEWRIARAASSIHGVSGLLACTLRWQGPDDWRAFLREQNEHIRVRHARMIDLLAGIGVRARAEGLAMLALKGAAIHALSLYEPGTRPMADLDLLVHVEDESRAAHVLETLGFRQAYVTERERSFELPRRVATPAFGEHSEHRIKVELHTRISEPLPLRAVDITTLLWRSPRAGLNDYPSRATLMTHLLLHAAGSMTVRALRLLQLLDIARLSSRMLEPDWDELIEALAAPREALWWAAPPLALTARYFRCIPERVLRETATNMPWLLKRACARNEIADVSLSYLWVDAFPGIEWARSFEEMLAFAARRILPGRHTLHRRRVIAETHSHFAEQAWTRMSQGRRILSWATSRQPRTYSLHVVRAALEQAH